VTTTTAQPTREAGTITPEVRRAALALIIGGIAAILDTTIVTIALHTLVLRLHSTVGTIQWVSTAYLLALTVAIPVTGWAEARWGGKRAPGRNRARAAGRGSRGHPAGPVQPVAGRRDRSRQRARPLLSGVVVLAVFAWWALRPGEHRPVVNIRLLAVRSLGSASAVLFTAGAAMYAGLFLLPLYYQDLRGEDVLVAALLLIPQGVGALVSRFVVGRLVGRFGASAVTIAAFLLAAVATVPFAFAGPRTSLWRLGIVLLVRGFGIGAVLIPPMSVAYYDVGPADFPHATMNTRIAQQVGASFGVAIVAVVLQSLLAHGVVSAFHTAFWWAFGITVAAFIPALALPAARTADNG
jgi:MFS family permease